MIDGEAHLKIDGLTEFIAPPTSFAFMSEAAHALNHLEELRATLDAAARFIVDGRPENGGGMSESEILARIDKSLLSSKA